MDTKRGRGKKNASRILVEGEGGGGKEGGGGGERWKNFFWGRDYFKPVSGKGGKKERKKKGGDKSRPWHSTEV